MNRFLPLPVIFLVLHVGLLAHALEPANPRGNVKARAILNYLEKLPQQTEKRLVSGQFTSYGPRANVADCQDAFDKTGTLAGDDRPGCLHRFRRSAAHPGYDDVIRLPKPFGFTEFGPHGLQKPPGDYDYLRFIAGVQTHFPKAGFFLAWHGTGGWAGTETPSNSWSTPGSSTVRTCRGNSPRARDR